MFREFYVKNVDLTLVLSFRSYKKEIFELTQEIYKTGLEKHESRLKEIQLFQERVNVTKSKTQREGIEYVYLFPPNFFFQN